VRIRIVDTMAYLDLDDGTCFPCTLDELTEAYPDFARPDDTSRIEYGGERPTVRIDGRGDQRPGPDVGDWVEGDYVVANAGVIKAYIESDRASDDGE